MRRSDLEFFIEQPQPWSRHIRVHIKSEDYIAKPMEYTKPPEGKMTPPCFELTNIAAQNLMDALWQAGFKPSEGTGSAGAMKATQDHLSDMRKLVFGEK